MKHIKYSLVFVALMLIGYISKAQNPDKPTIVATINTKVQNNPPTVLRGNDLNAILKDILNYPVDSIWISNDTLYYYMNGATKSRKINGGAPTGTAGGDLNGTYPNPTVDGLQGRAVVSTAPTNLQALAWSTTNNRWEPGCKVDSAFFRNDSLFIIRCATQIYSGKVNASGINQLTGDVTAGPGTGSVAATIAANAVTNAKIRQSAGLSVIGNSTNATANVADITAANDAEVLRRNGTTIGFGQIATGGIIDAAITYAKIQNVTATRLSGRYSGTNGPMQEIKLGTNLSFSNDTLNAASGGGGLGDPGGNGVVVRTALNTTINRTLTGTTNHITITNGDGVSGNPTFDVGTDVAQIDVANAWSDGVKQTFNPNATNAGLNVGSHTADPSSPANGDIIYQSTANELHARINGAWVTLGAGGTPSLTATYVGFGSGSNLLTGNANLTYSEASGSALQVMNTSGVGDAVPKFDLYLNKGTPATNDRLGEIHFYGKDAAGNKTQFTAIYSESPVVTNGAESGRLLNNVIVNGTVHESFNVGPNSSNDGTLTVIGQGLYYDQISKKLSVNNSAPTGYLQIENSVNGRMAMALVNTNTAGTSAFAEMFVGDAVNLSGSAGIRMIKFGDAYTTGGQYIQNSALIESGDGLTGGLTISNASTAITRIYNNNAETWRITSAGRLSNTGSDGTAQIHLKAHSTAASSAPIKLTSGTAMTTAEDGALEYHSSHLYFTIGSTRYQLDQQSAGGGQSAIQFKDEGSNIGTSGAVTAVDFVGSGVTASHSAGTVTVTISGGGSITGSGTNNVITKWTGTSSIGNSLMQDDGTNTAINMAPTTHARLSVLGQSGTSSTTATIKAYADADQAIYMGYNTTSSYGFIGAVTDGASHDNIIIAQSGGKIILGASTTFGNESVKAIGRFRAGGATENSDLEGSALTGYFANDGLSLVSWRDATGNVEGYLAAGSSGTNGVHLGSVTNHALYFRPNLTAVATMFPDGTVAIGTTTDQTETFFVTGSVKLERSDAVTNAVTYGQKLTHISSGTVAANFGTGTEYELENASGTNRVAAAQDIFYTDATNATEDASFRWATIKAGTLTNQMLLNSDGELLVNTSTDAGTYNLQVAGAGFIKTTTADVSTANTVLRLARESTGTPAAGYGTILEFVAENGSGTQTIIGEIQSVYTVVTESAEDAYMSFKTVNGGAKVEQFRITGTGNVIIGGGTSFDANSSKVLWMHNGGVPSTSATNGIALYSEDVAASAELKVRDEAGNITTLSPHNFTGIPQGRSEEMAWAFYSEKDGKYVNVDMLKLARLMEKLTGEKLVYTGKINEKPNPKNK